MPDSPVADLKSLLAEASRPSALVKISPALDGIVARATALALDQRYGSARELLADLTAALEISHLER